MKVFFGLVCLPSVACLAHLWLRARGSLAKKVGWTLALGIPVLGPIFYGSIYERLTPHNDRGPGDRGGLPPGGETGGW